MMSRSTVGLGEKTSVDEGVGWRLYRQRHNRALRGILRVGEAPGGTPSPGSKRWGHARSCPWAAARRTKGKRRCTKRY